MIFQIDDFLEFVKEDQPEEFSVRALLDEMYKKETRNVSKNLVILYNKILPEKVGMRRKVLKQIIELVCGNLLENSASITFGYIQKTENTIQSLTIDYVERLSHHTSVLQDSTSRILKLSTLKCLIGNFGGTIQVKYSSDNRIFGILLSLPLSIGQ